MKIYKILIKVVFGLILFNSLIYSSDLPTEDPKCVDIHPMLKDVLEAGPFEPQWKSLVTHKLPDWFKNDKIGLSAHWGPYAVPGWTPRKDTPYGVAYAEWYWMWMKTNEAVKKYHTDVYNDVPYDDFFDGTKNNNTGKTDGFFTKNFDADEWMKTFKEAGVKYFFITSKHHDGFCLWDTKYTDRNAMKHGPKRDLLREIVDAARKHGLRVGFYYSFYEWFNPIYNGESDLSKYKGIKQLNDEDGDGVMNEYVDDFMIPQIKELIDNFQPDYLCFDGEWDHGYVYWKARQIAAYYLNQAAARGQEVVINDRYGQSAEGLSDTRGVYGDFYHVEYFADIDKTKPWSMWRGFGNSYGYNSNEHPDNILKSKELIEMIIDITSEGGNCEFNLGPKPNGKLADFEYSLLKSLGNWMKVNDKAIYNTKRWRQRFQLKENSEDKEIYFTYKEDGYLYAICPQWPGNELIIKNFEADKKSKVTFLTSGKKLKWKNVNGNMKIELPKFDKKFEKNDLSNAYVFGITNVQDFVANPKIKIDYQSLSEKPQVSVLGFDNNVEIYYTLDGSRPTLNSARYTSPVTINKSCTISIRACKKGKVPSDIICKKIKVIDKYKKITFLTEPAKNYQNNLEITLCDKVKGSKDFTDGKWLGFEGKDIEIVVDLGKMKKIKTISTGFLHDPNSWVFQPVEIQFLVSKDGKKFKEIRKITKQLSEDDQESQLIKVAPVFKSAKARYVKMVAKNIGKCPEWHKGKDGKAWLFIDEIKIK